MIRLAKIVSDKVANNWINSVKQTTKFMTLQVSSQYT